MKFRATTNSIRIRVRKSDLEQLKGMEWVYEQVAFPGGGTWSFGLLISGEDIAVRMEDNTLIVDLPREQALAWINSNEVGIEQYIPLEGDEKLHILLEKDFPCKTRDEDISDTFFELEEGTC